MGSKIFFNPHKAWGYDLGKTDVKNSTGKGTYKSLFYFISPQQKQKSADIGRLSALSRKILNCIKPNKNQLKANKLHFNINPKEHLTNEKN